jgi:hypothetical protein
MKRFTRLSASLTLAFCFIFMITSMVSARRDFPPMITVPDPYAVSSIDNSGLTTELVSVPSLPGTVLLDSGKYAPVNDKAGDTQFSASGLVLSGLGKGETSRVCFPFRDYNYKWSGAVNQWNGTKWVPLVTTFPADAEGNTNWACTIGKSNGTYALITWYYGPAEPVVTYEEPK